MASPITFGGLASGLDTKAIIAALVAVEGRKVEFLRRDKSVYQARVSAYDELLSKLKKLEEAVETLADRDSFLAHKATLSDGAEDFLQATPGGSAAAGAYQIGITSLAQSTFIRSDGFADANASLGLSGTLSIQVGATTTNVTVDAANDSLLGLRDAIEDSAAEVSATVVFDGTDYHLELRGAETGLSNAVTLLSEPPGAGGPVLNLAQVRAAADARFTIDGQSFTSASNTVEDAIQGVTLQLLDEQAAGAPALQLTIGEDFEGVKKQLKGFVDAYNEVVKFLNQQSAARASSEDDLKPLSGESAPRHLRTALSRIVSDDAAVSSDYKSLASLGIKSTSDGTLKIEDSKLGDALADDLSGIVRLFTDASDGIGQRLLDAVEARTDPIVGVIDLRKGAFKTTIRNLDNRIRRAQDALDVFEQSLVQKYAQLERLISTLQSQGASLGAIGVTATRLGR
jgi:flagellar hook-associated protein 2